MGLVSTEHIICMQFVLYAENLMKGHAPKHVVKTTGCSYNLLVIDCCQTIQQVALPVAFPWSVTVSLWRHIWAGHSLHDPHRVQTQWDCHWLPDTALFRTAVALSLILHLILSQPEARDQWEKKSPSLLHSYDRHGRKFLTQVPEQGWCQVSLYILAYLCIP